MKIFNLSYGYWILTKAAKNLGLWGLFGLFLVVVSLLIYLTKVIAVEKELSASFVELAHREKAKTELHKSIAVPQQTSAQEIENFYAIFPSGHTLPKWLGLIDDSATKQHLLLNRGDYKLLQTKQGRLMRYEIVLPVVGKYIQVRHFIASLLYQMPALALSDIQIKREDSLSPTVETRLVFVLFLQSDGWK